MCNVDIVLFHLPLSLLFLLVFDCTFYCHGRHRSPPLRTQNALRKGGAACRAYVSSTCFFFVVTRSTREARGRKKRRLLNLLKPD